MASLTSTTVLLALQIYRYGLWKVIAKVCVVLLRQRLPSDDWWMLAPFSVHSDGQNPLHECRGFVPSNACSTFSASLALVSKYGIWPLLLHHVCALLVVTCLLSADAKVAGQGNS